MPGEDSPLAKAIEDLKARISAVDAEAPVVPHRLAAREEARPVEVVTEAIGLVA